MFNSNASFMQIGRGGNDDQICWDWFRFASVPIPPGAVITSAYLYWCSNDTTSTLLPVVHIRAEAADNPTAPTSAADGASRVLTTASVTYSVPSLTGSAWYATSQFPSVIQEVIGRPGWTSGNAIQIIVDGTGTGSNYFVAAKTFNAVGTPAPWLRVTYYMPPNRLYFATGFEQGEASLLGFDIITQASTIYPISQLTNAHVTTDNYRPGYGRASLDLATENQYGGVRLRKCLPVYYEKTGVVRFAYYTDDAVHSNVTIAFQNTAYVRETVQARINDLVCGAHINIYNGQIQINCQMNNTSFAGSTNLANSAPGIIRQNSWMIVEAKFVYHATCGSVEVKLDGELVASVYGVPTVYNTAAVGYDLLYCWFGWAHPYYLTSFVDDIAVGEDWIGDGGCVGGYPIEVVSSDFSLSDQGASEVLGVSLRDQHTLDLDKTRFVYATGSGSGEYELGYPDLRGDETIEYIAMMNDGILSVAGLGRQQPSLVLDGEEYDGPVRGLSYLRYLGATSGFGLNPATASGWQLAAVTGAMLKVSVT